jgi:hypothetical protein
MLSKHKPSITMYKVAEKPTSLSISVYPYKIIPLTTHYSLLTILLCV